MKWLVGKFLCLAGVFVLATLLFADSALGSQSISLTWDPDLSSGTTGYYLYFGPSSGDYPTRIDVGSNTVVTLTGLADGSINYFVVRAYNRVGAIGLPSNEAQFVVPVAGLSPQTAAVSPASAAVGAQVYVYGVNFNSAYLVQFGGITASFVPVSGNELIATVPPGARSGNLTVTTTSGSVSTPFTVVPAAAPANDNFAHAQVLSGVAQVLSLNNSGATREAGEPKHAGDAGVASVWYRWTAPYTGTWTLNTTGSDFTPLLAVYTGSALASLTPVASNRVAAGSYGATLNFPATAGLTYQIALDGPGGATGNFALSLAPRSSLTTVISNGFEPAEGFALAPLGGQGGWLSTGTASNWIKNGAIPGYGQQASLGFGTATPATISTLKRPLNYTVDTNGCPIIQFSVTMQVQTLNTLFRNTYAWVVENAAGHELFRLNFNNASGSLGYTLDNGVPMVTGLYFNSQIVYNLVVTMDFSQNTWTAWLNGYPVITGLPITTTGAALTLGDIAAAETFGYSGYGGSDGLVFDNYQVTAGPAAQPRIVAGLSNVTVAAGSPLWLGVVASGSPVLAYQWYFNSAALPGANSSALTIPAMTTSQAGNYSVTVSNYAGAASSSATVNVTAAAPRALFSTAVTGGNSGAVFNLNVAIANNYRLQASTNLKDWTTLSSFFAGGTNVTCYDPSATNFPRRFYRLASP